MSVTSQSQKRIGLFTNPFLHIKRVSLRDKSGFSKNSHSTEMNFNYSTNFKSANNVRSLNVVEFELRHIPMVNGHLRYYCGVSCVNTAFTWPMGWGHMSLAQCAPDTWLNSSVTAVPGIGAYCCFVSLFTACFRQCHATTCIRFSHMWEHCVLSTTFRTAWSHCRQLLLI